MEEKNPPKKNNKLNQTNNKPNKQNPRKTTNQENEIKVQQDMNE